MTIMLRTAITRSATSFTSFHLLRTSSRLFTMSAIRPNSSGEAGSVGSGYARPGGEAQGDSFTKREKAAEDYYIRKKEKEKLLQLREKLQQQRKHLDELDTHIEELMKEQGGEQN